MIPTHLLMTEERRSAILELLDASSIPCPASGCRLWFGLLNEKGYGRVNINGRMIKVHRLRWELDHGPIPFDVNICHRCDVRCCIEPLHLFAGLQADNVADMMAKGRHVPPPTLYPDRPKKRIGVGTPRGENSAASKLTDEKVRLIRSSLAKHAELAVILGVDRKTVRMVRAGETWSHVK